VVSELPPDPLRDAFLLGYEEPSPDRAAHLLRQALASRVERRRQARERTVRRLASGLAVAIAVLIVVTLLTLRFSAAPQRQPSATPSPAPPEPSSAAIVYVGADDPTELLQVGYDGLPQAGRWPLPGALATQGIVSVSPDGTYAVTFDRISQAFQVVDAFGQLAAAVPSGPSAPNFGVWSRDAGHVCQLALTDPLTWRLLITTVPSGGFGPVAVRIPDVPYRPSVTVAACDPSANRAVLIEPQTDAVGAAARGAERKADVVDLTDGSVVRRISLGDTTHGTVFSQDARFVARVDYDRGTTSIISLDTGKTVRVERAEVRGFSGDSSRIVENTADMTRILDLRSGRVLYSQKGWTSAVRSGPGTADLALNVLPGAPAGDNAGPAALVIVPAAGAVTFIPNAIAH
jgi:hypothetical protein